MSASDEATELSESTGRPWLRIKGLRGGDLRDEESDPAAWKQQTQNLVVDEPDTHDICSDVEGEVATRTPTVEAADSWSPISTASAPDGEVPEDCDRHGLRPARGIVVAILLSFGFWALVAIGLL